MFESPVRQSGTEVLWWLIRHRWLAVAGQLAAILAAVVALRMEFELLPLACGLFLLALSNHRVVPGLDGRDGRIGRILVLDVALFTWTLFWTGGAANPFVIFYLLNLMLAAMLLDRRGVCLVGLLSAAGFLLISRWSKPFEGPPRWVDAGRLTPELDSLGSGIALLSVGVILAVFAFAMRRELIAGERRLRQGAQRIAELERFKSLATLAAGVAHEMGTPLGTIAIAAKDLERSLPPNSDPSDLARDARLIRQEVERCRAILKRLDRQSTQGTGSRRERVTPQELLAALDRRLPRQWLERLQPRCPCPRQTLCLPVDAVLQSLVVLIENGCEADESGGPVTLTIDCPGTTVCFRVCDRGHGMSNEVQRRAGEPYFTTKSQEGSGLGLFLVRTLALELGGEISLNPNAEGGTCATLVLPTEPSDEDALEASADRR